MTAVQVTAVVLWVGVTLYAVFGGADFGAGIWDLLAGGAEAGQRPRALIADAIAPVWEANHTWLIFDLVILWTAFPSAFAAIMSTLFVPLTVAGLGIVLRGAAFAFRPVAPSLRSRRIAGATFALGSLVTPFVLGLAAGAIASGRVVGTTAGGGAPGDSFASWINPTSIFVGLLAVVACAYLAAVFLVIDARRVADPVLQRYFLRRAMGSAVAAGVLALAGVVVLHVDAPVLATGLEHIGWPLIVASGVCGGLALESLRRGARSGTRLLAIGAVVAVVWGWGVAQYPDILPGSLSLADAAAPPSSLDALLVIFIVAALVIGPSLVLLFTLDQRNRLQAHGLGSDLPALKRGDPEG